MHVLNADNLLVGKLNVCTPVLNSSYAIRLSVPYRNVTRLKVIAFSAY
jgi:hypothetical protein